jgi:hypothetical protein
VVFDGDLAESSLLAYRASSTVDSMCPSIRMEPRRSAPLR